MAKPVKKAKTPNPRQIHLRLVADVSYLIDEGREGDVEQITNGLKIRLDQIMEYAESCGLITGELAATMDNLSTEVQLKSTKR